MIGLLRLILHIVASLFKPRAKLVAEILVLRQQLNVLRRQVSKRPQLRNTDRLLAEPRGEPRRINSSEAIGIAAGAERNDHGYRLGRPAVLCRGRGPT